MKAYEKLIGIAVLFSLLFSIASFAGSPASGEAVQDALDEIRAKGAMNVCYISYPPFSSKDLETGRMEGIGIDIIEGIAKKAGFKTNYIETTWGNLVLDLKSGRCSANVSGIFPLIERSYGEVMFSEAYGYLGNNGVIRKGDERFHSLEELNREGITVAVIEGEQGHEYAKKYLPKANLHVISSGDISLAFVEVSAGRADAGLGDSMTVELYLNEHDELRPLLEEPYLLRELTIAVNENDAKLLNFLNNAIDVLATSGELREIYSKYDFKSIIPKTA